MTDEEGTYWATVSANIGPMLHAEVMLADGVESPEQLFEALTQAFVKLTAAFQEATGIEVDLDINTGTDLQ